MRTAAAIAAASGDDVGAVLILEKLAHALERAGLNLDLVWAQIDLGRSLARVDRDRAVVVLTSAAGLAERCGAVSEGRLASQALRRLGVRAWRRGPAAIGKGIDSLSERERDVARRVAEGSNNREIALALAVSPKTVDRHVTNIFAKLGARNRTELAGMFLADSVRGSTDD